MKQSPASHSFSVKVYQQFLRLYPPAFRDQYEAEIVQVFATCCHAYQRESGWWGRFSFYLHTLLDLLVTASQERWYSWVHHDEWERSQFMLRSIDESRPFMEEVATVLEQKPDYYTLFVSQIESLQSVGAVADWLSLDGDLSDPDVLFALFQNEGDATAGEATAPRWLARLTSAVRQSLHDVSPGPSAQVTGQMIERIYANPVLFELIAAEEVGQQLVDVVESLALDGNAEEIDEMLTLMQALGDQ